MIDPIDPQAQSRGLTDALRSLHRYASIVLPPEYSVYQSQREPRIQRPAAVVSPLEGYVRRGGVSSDGVTRSGAFHTIDVAAPFEMACFPPETIDYREGQAQAMTLQRLIEDAFDFGLQGVSYHMRVPMWDWSTTPPGELMAPEDDVIIDYYRVPPGGISVSSRPDPDDTRLWTVSGTIRLEWTRHPPLAPTQPVASVGVRPGTVD